MNNNNTCIRGILRKLMFIKLFALSILFVQLLPTSALSPVHDNENQQQLPRTNKLVNQPTLSAIQSNTLQSTSIKWIKSLKNLTETGGRRIVLECQVQSIYPVKFNWYRYNNPIDSNRFIITENAFQSSIRLRNPKESISGFYMCEVSNAYQMLTSTGFVRVQPPVDFTDDSLLSIEFQPEIISSNGPTIKCQLYTGDICRSYLKSKYISITNLDIEQNLIDNIKYLAKECREYFLPMICLFVYPICDDNRMNIRSICRKSCFYFQKHSCMRQLSHSLNSLTCENLPPSSDDPSCLKIDPYRNNRTKTNRDNKWSILQRFFSLWNSFPMVLVTICLPVALICLFVLIAFCCCRNESTRKTPPNPLLSPFHSTIHQNILSSSSSSTNTNLTNFIQRQTGSAGHSLYEIPMTNIRILQEIGEGEFGRIYIGELMDCPMKYIIKALENEKMKQDFVREIEIFHQIHHVNISNLVGLCLQPENALSLTIHEYLNHGDLHEYLVQHRSKSIELHELLYISVQIVSGMIYLSEKKFLHNDLSARNIFISEHLDVKITNIARYRSQYQLDYYKLANRLLPVRWMSIEILTAGIYSEMSDVWSFGVLLWEMFSDGMQPYHGQTNPEVIEMIRDGKLLTCPSNCPKRIYALMCSCWEEISEQRPTFIELMRRFRQLKEKSATTSLIDDEVISANQMQSPKTLDRKLLTTHGRLIAQKVVEDRNSFRFQV